MSYGSQTGTKLWERKRFGAPPKYEAPEALWEDAVGYFEWCLDNPLYESKLVSYQGISQLEKIPKVRAFTLAGLSLYCGFTQECWGGWKRKRPDLFRVISQIEQTIWEQKFSNASADLLNANIISRELGLADRVDATSNGKHIAETPKKELTEDEFKAELERRGIAPNLFD